MGIEYKQADIITPYFENTFIHKRYDMLNTCIYCNQLLKDIIVSQLDFFTYVGYCNGCYKRLTFDIESNVYKCKIEKDLVLFIWINNDRK